MVGTSKILTVSYGTFSCTLEGFDDSFDTMKAIAEYFRGLASDDRYFGAEPPTPDAEMLASIAEREISRRVDARMDNGGIVLRAAALSDQSTDAGADAGAVTVANDAAKAARKAEKAEAKAARKAAKADAKAEAVAKAEADAKVAQDAQAEADAKAQAEADTLAAELAPAEPAVTDILNSVSAATAEPTEGTTGADVEETRDVALSSMLAADDPAPVNILPAHPDSESVAAKLQRIRAVVGKTGTTASDDLTAQILPQSDAPDVADVAADAHEDLVAEFDAHAAEMEEATQADPEDQVGVEDPTEPADTAGGDDMIARVMARQNDDTPSQDDAVDAPAQDPVEAQAEVDQPRARVIRMKRSDFEKSVADGEIVQAETALPDVQAPAAPTGPDFALLDGADDLDDYLEDSDFTDTDVAIDDVDFAQDLKAITDKANGDIDAAADDPVETIAVEDAVIDAPATDLHADEPQVDDQALDRLMDETDAQMQEPEGSRRRDAIAQLKAAVAAKEAARQVGEPEDDGEDVENAFRNDLSEVVHPEGSTAPRPRPVVRNVNRTERPRPAPLKLVAAQRVDLPETVQRDGPVVPRRVAARKDDGQPQPNAAGSFAEFAENMGVSELPDLLEAAAAYTSFVEGADEFSRPQILRRVRAVSSDDFNREDGLRSFADLLRSGRFTKVRNGRFQVADDSRFNPESRAS